MVYLGNPWTRIKADKSAMCTINRHLRVPRELANAPLNYSIINLRSLSWQKKNDETRYQKDMGYLSQFPMFPMHHIRSILTLHHLWNRVSLTFFPLSHPFCRHRCLPRAAHLHEGEAGVDSGSSSVSSPHCSSSLLP